MKKHILSFIQRGKLTSCVKVLQKNSSLDLMSLWKKLVKFCRLVLLLAFQILKIWSIYSCLDFFHSVTFILKEISTEWPVSHLIKPFIGAPVFWYICQGVFCLFAPKYILSTDPGKIIFHPVKCLLSYYSIRFVYSLLSLQ